MLITSDAAHCSPRSKRARLTEETNLSTSNANHTPPQTLSLGSEAVVTDSNEADSSDQSVSGYFSVSADCKLCGAHFVNFARYRDHLKMHFDDDPDKGTTHFLSLLNFTLSLFCAHLVICRMAGLWSGLSID